MTIDTDDLYNSIIESFSKMTYIKASEIPGIDLYVDQVTTFIDERLRSTARDKLQDEKLLTKTMINNYAKNEVIPPPIRKKYNKEHVLLLIIVYYFKSMLQISDIKELLEPIVNDMFGHDSTFNIEDVYREIFSTKGSEIEQIQTDVLEKYEASMQSFEEAPDDKKDYLQTFSFVCRLAGDVFVKKLLIEKIIDSLKDHKEAEGETVNKYDVTPDKKTVKEAEKEAKQKGKK